GGGRPGGGGGGFAPAQRPAPSPRPSPSPAPRPSPAPSRPATGPGGAGQSNLPNRGHSVLGPNGGTARGGRDRTATLAAPRVGAGGAEGGEGGCVGDRERDPAGRCGPVLARASLGDCPATAV